MFGLYAIANPKITNIRNGDYIINHRTPPNFSHHEELIAISKEDDINYVKCIYYTLIIKSTDANFLVKYYAGIKLKEISENFFNQIYNIWLESYIRTYIEHAHRFSVIDNIDNLSIIDIQNGYDDITGPHKKKNVKSLLSRIKEEDKDYLCTFNY